MPPRLADLRDVNPSEELVFGGKACGLARLIDAGARVPPGFAITATTQAPDAWPAVLRDELARRGRELLARGPVAVRSSALVEDGAQRSFAGLFESVLWVSDEIALRAALGRCVASGGSERVLTYAGASSPLPVGVVVQSMVAARAAGVCFTLDPAGRDRAVVIEAVSGTGDALVSGRTQPERWRVYRTGLGGLETHRDRHGPPQVLAPREAEEIALRALALVERFGRPLDLEWARDAECLYFVQARPITAAREPIEWVIERSVPGMDDGPVSVWANFNVRETMPDPFTPLNWTLWRDVVLRVVSDDILGLRPGSRLAPLLAGLDLVHGRIYWNMNAMLAWPCGGPMLGQLETIDARAGLALVELRRRGVLGPRRTKGSKLLAQLGLLATGACVAARMFALQSPRRCLETLAATGRAVAARADVAGFSDALLLRELRLLGEPESVGLRRGMQMLASSLLSYGLADLAFRRYPEARRMLPVGISGNPTTQISLGIDRLVDAARPLAEVFRGELPTPERLEAIAQMPGGRAWLAELDDFLARCGQRGPKEFDIAAPRWADDPTMILELVRAGLDAKGETATQRLSRLAAQRERVIAAAVAQAPFWRRPALRWLARRAAEVMPLREAPKHYAMYVFQRMRQAALELGERLVRRHAIDVRDDVFFLEYGELQALAAGAGAATDYRSRVRERRERFEHYRREKPPDIVRSDGVPVLEEEEAAADGVLRGTGASSGTATGPVRVLRTPDPAALAEGEVLVVEFADPGWTPLFPRASALVMEVGGSMCHAAVVARELGIPAVFGVSRATSLLRAGQPVTVDGSAGTVRPG